MLSDVSLYKDAWNTILTSMDNQEQIFRYTAMLSVLSIGKHLPRTLSDTRTKTKLVNLLINRACEEVLGN